MLSLELLINHQLFAMPLNTPKLHSQLIDVITTYLQALDFEVQKEHIVHYQTVSKNNVIWPTCGVLDLLITGKKRKVAIEFDKGNHIRYKSVEKLFKSDCPIQIAIARGNLSGRSTFDANLERIESRIRRFGRPFKEFWLVILSERRTYKLYNRRAPSKIKPVNMSTLLPKEFQCQK